VDLTMAVSTRALDQALGAIVGADAVRQGDNAALVDGVMPRWVVAPASAAELGCVVALAHEERLSVVPRGSGSAMALGHPLRCADLVVDLARMDEVLEYNPDDLTVTVSAGTTLEALAARLHPRGQCLPLDPPGGATRTLGGIVATAASGPLRARYGTMRDLLLGVRFVQADGVVTWGGAKVVKSVTGYDIPKLIVGALGTLGVLAQLTLRLHPAPACERTSIAAFPGAEAAQAFVAALVDSALQPNRVEWLNAAAAHVWGEGSSAASIAVSVGSVEAAVQAQQAQIERLAHRAGGQWRPADQELWLRHGHTIAARPDGITLRVATLASHLGQTVRGIEGAVAAMGAPAPVAVTGCAPLGVLRAQVFGVGVQEGVALVAQLRDAVAPVGGSVVVEAAAPALRAALDPWGPVAPNALDLMRAIKEQFDPNRILNPGRFVGGL
jgi:glycolate dehydrogenase FAD-binding subunit